MLITNLEASFVGWLKFLSYNVLKLCIIEWLMLMGVHIWKTVIFGGKRDEVPMFSLG